MNNYMSDEYYQREKSEFDKALTSLSNNVTSWEAQAVDEIIAAELDDLYHLAICRSSGLCPVCYTETSSWENEIDDDLLEVTHFCPHCGWESDPTYE